MRLELMRRAVKLDSTQEMHGSLGTVSYLRMGNKDLTVRPLQNITATDLTKLAIEVKEVLFIGDSIEAF